MKPHSWPFRPDHITNNGEYYDDRPILKKLNGIGIITNEHLRGIQTSMCANLGNPTTVIEFSPLDVPIRTDSRLLVHDLHPPCRLFREHTSHRYCYLCDNAHAKLFHGLTEYDIENKIETKIEVEPPVKYYKENEKYYGNKKLKLPSFEKRKKMMYLEYDCPLLGYRELIFPIFFEKKVIGVFFIGEICLQEQLGYIEEMQRDFLSSVDFNEEYKNMNVATMITNAHAEWICKDSKVWNRAKYEEMIDDTYGEILGLQTTLVQQMKLERESYVKRKMDERIREFRTKLPMTITPEIREGNLKFLWQALGKTLNGIREDFAIKYVIVFGVNQLKTKNVGLLDVVTYAGELPNEITDKIDDVKFCIDDLPATALTQPTTTLVDKRIFGGLKNFGIAVGPKANLIRTFPVPLSTQNSIAVLVGYYDRNPPNSIENFPGGYLDTSIQSFYTVVLSALSSILAFIAQDYLKSTFRILGHELGQLSSAIDWLRTRYMSDLDYFSQLPKRKLRDLSSDLASYTKQLSFLSIQSNLLLELPSLDKESFNAFGTIIFKWRDIYRSELELYSLAIVIPKIDSADTTRPPIYGDKVLLEQLVYNLVSNAVKYCYRGTKIHLDCVTKERGGKLMHILTVRNYGIEIDGGEEIYDMYSRGKNVGAEQGLGLGLYIAKRIAIAHKGSIRYHCSEISPFKLPLIRPYMKYRFDGKDEKIVELLRLESKTMMYSRIYTDAIAMRGENQLYSDTSRYELADSIMEPTYEVTFIVEIPAEEVHQ